MAHSIPYKGIERKEIEQLLREAEVVPSFAGSSYAQMHKSVIQEIQIQKDCNGKAVQRGMHMTINSGFDDSLRLQPDIEELIGQLSQIALKHGDGDNPVTTELLTSLQELATSCINILALLKTFTTAAVHLCVKDPAQNSRIRDSAGYPCGG